MTECAKELAGLVIRLGDLGCPLSTSFSFLNNMLGQSFQWTAQEFWQKQSVERVYNIKCFKLLIEPGGEDEKGVVTLDVMV